MDISAYFSFLQTVVGGIPFSLFDVVVIVAAIIFLASENRHSVIRSTYTLIAVVCILILSLGLYSFISSLLQSYLQFGKGTGDILSLLALFLVFAGIARIIYAFLVANLSVEMTQAQISGVGILCAIPVCILGIGMSAIFILSSSTDVTAKYAITHTKTLLVPISSVLSLDRAMQRIVGQDNASTLLLQTHTAGKETSIPFSATRIGDSNKEQMSELQFGVHALRQSTSLSSREVLDTVAMRIGNSVADNGMLGKDISAQKSIFDLLSESQVPYQNAHVLMAIAPDSTIVVQGLSQDDKNRELIRATSINSMGTVAIPLSNNQYLYIILLVQ